jgi:nucleotide-binding universal stress UspA family protein
MKLNTILVPLDGSPLAEAALSTATDLAKSSGARVVLLRAAEAHTVPGADRLAEAEVRVVREAEEYLARIKQRVLTVGVEDVEASVWYGSAAHAVVEAAKAQKVDLIVMTTHGRSGFGRLILGSVAESVMRGTTTPILLLRDRAAPVEAPAAKGGARPWAG